MKRRLLAVLLAIALVMTLIPAALAEEAENSDSSVTVEVTGDENTTVDPGEGENTDPSVPAEGEGETTDPVAPTEGEGENTDPSAPAEGEGETTDPVAPTEGEGENTDPSAPAEGEGETTDPVAPTEGEGETTDPAAPAEGEGETTDPVAPTEGEGETTDPAAPTESEVETTDPAAPTTPETPEVPETPETPENPEEPVTPEQPAEEPLTDEQLEEYYQQWLSDPDSGVKGLTDAQMQQLNDYINVKQGEIVISKPEQPVTPVTVPEFDVEAAYEKLLACETEEEIEAFLSGLNEDELEDLKEYINNIPCVVDENPVTIPFTEASPFLPPVYVPYVVQQRKVVRSSTESGFSEINSGNIVSTYASNDEYGSSDGLGMKKTAKVVDVATGKTQITLEAFTTGTVKTSTKTTPCDIVFVIDQSGSMAWGMAGENSVISDSNPERMAATKKVMQTFLERVVDNATDSAGNVLAHHRIAVIGFSSSGYNNNELLTGVAISNKNGAQYGSITEDQYRAALQDVTTQAGYQNVLDAINALSTNGGTEPVYGFNMAHEVFRNDPGVQGETSRQRVVVFLTDGEPDNIGSTGYGHQVAEEAVAAAYPLKKTDGATVYTIGMFSGANADYIGETGTAMRDISIANRANRFMNLASSNYPEASKFYLKIIDFGVQWRWLDDVPERAEGNYYLVANKASDLEEIFQTIQESVSSATIELGAETVIKDVLSDYFELPSGTADGIIKLYTVECTGMNNGEFTFDDDNQILIENGASATISSDRRSIEVTGFNFNEHYVTADVKPGTSNDHGRKLVITLTVTPKADFWGGDGVPTNGDTSGVYKDDELLENFTVPTVNVPVSIPAPDGKDLNLYYGNKVEASDLYTAHTRPAEDSDDYWKSEYIDFTKIGYTIGDVQSPTVEDKTYFIGVTYDGKDVTKGEKASTTVTVFKPEVTFQESTIYYSQNPGDYAANIPANNVTWKNSSGKTDVDVGMSSIAVKPNVNYDFEPEDKDFTDCTLVQATIKLNGNEYTGFKPERFTVHVLLPTITWADTTCYYGDYMPTNYTPTGVSWACADNKTSADAYADADHTKLLTPPTMSYTFDVADSTVMPNSDVPVKVTGVKADTTEIPLQKVTFEWKLNNSCCSTGEKVPADAQFTVHPLTCTLTITKSGCNESLDPNQSFIFTVNSDSNNRIKITELMVTVQENGSVTIEGLPTGTYTIEEESDWSWRYQLDSISNDGEVKLSKDKNFDAVTITNTRPRDKWLDGNAVAVNNWNSTGTTVTRKSTRRKEAE